MKRIVFFNLAIMPYHVSVFKELSRMQCEQHVFWYAKAPKTSYRAPQIEDLTQYNRFDYSTALDLIKIVKAISPQLVVCSGWTDSI